MKKVIVIALLITVLSALLLCGGVCLAEDGQTNYYYVDKGNELTVRSSASQEGSVVMQIPATYAFEYVEAQDEFIKIRYNSYENGYISKSDFNSFCKPVTSNWGDKPYFYTITLTNSNINDTVTVYTDPKTSVEPIPKSIINVNKVYSYYRNGSDYYFFVQVNMTFGSTDPFNAYIKVSETSLSSFNKDTIPESAGYAAEIKATADSAANGGDSTLEPSENGNGSVPATNNFERYLLIAVIAVLCVVIIILIFAPNKSRRKQ